MAAPPGRVSSGTTRTVGADGGCSARGAPTSPTAFPDTPPDPRAQGAAAGPEWSRRKSGSIGVCCGYWNKSPQIEWVTE